MRELAIILIIFSLNQIIQAQTQKPEACSLPNDEGTGSEDGEIYLYYNGEKDHCYPFLFKGGGGNANRFITEKQCMRNCSAKAEALFPSNEKQACYLAKTAGQCLGRYLRYYYSAEHHTCKSFYWTGCVGNGNRFFSMEKCNATCYNAADEGLEDLSGETDVPVALILGILLGLIGAIVIIVVIVFAVKKPSSKKGTKKENKEEKTAAQPLKVETIELGEAETASST